MPRVLGLDFGDRRWGISLSDESGRFAYPRETAEGKEMALSALSRLIAEEGADRIVVGLPLNMDGSQGPKAREVLRLVEDLKARFSIPVETWDERLTTREAEGYLRDAGLGKTKWKGKVDRMAAQILLQSWLDAHRPSETPSEPTSKDDGDDSDAGGEGLSR